MTATEAGVHGPSRPVTDKAPRSSGHFERFDRRSLVVVGALLTALLVWLLPVVGLVASVLLLCLIPLGTFVRDRLAVMNIMVLFAATVAFGILGLAIALTTVQIAATLGCLLVAGWGTLSPHSLRVPSFDSASWILFFAMGVSLILMVGPFVGASPGQVLSGMMDGWDHSTHFSLFVGYYDQGVAQFLTDDGDPAMGVTYPSVPGWLWAALAPALVGDGVPAAELLRPYMLLSGLAAAISLGALTAMAADVSGRLAATRRTGAAAGAVVCGLGLVVGTFTLFQDHGHVNYLMAVTVAATGSWYSVVALADGHRTLSLLVIIAAAVTTAVMYPPMALATVVSGVWVMWHVLDRHPRLRWVSAGLLVLAGAGVVFGRRSLVSSVVGEIDALVPLTGGLQPFDVMVVAICPGVALVLCRLAFVRGVRGPMVGLLGSLVGLGAAAAIFAWRGVLQGVALADSYYTVKLILGLWVIASVLLAVLVASWFTGFLAWNSASGQAFSGRWASLAWLGLVLVVAASSGYVGPKPSGLPGGSPVSPGLSTALRRVDLVNHLPDGSTIIAASDLLRTQGGQPILWDGGDLKNNHYLMALHGYVGNGERALISTFPTPFGAEAARLLTAYLRMNPTQSVQIVYRDQASEAILTDLRRQFPDQVTLLQLPQ